MTDRSLRKFGRRLDDPYDVMADGVTTVGRIMLFTNNPTARPWAGTVAPGHERLSATYGYF
jgi:hypothetical protein